MVTYLGGLRTNFFGRRYIFDIYSAKNRAHFLWCKTVKKWALLYSSMVRVENESVIIAKCVKNYLKNGHLPTFCPLLKCKSGLNACLLRCSKIAKNRVFGVFFGYFWGILAIFVPKLLYNNASKGRKY